VAVGVEREQAFSRARVLSKTTTKLEGDVFLYLFGLVDPEVAEVVVLELFRVIQGKTMNTTTVPKLKVEVGLVVLLDTWLRDTMPASLLVVASQQHIPRRRLKLGSGLT
jgi:hypothetical protein